MKVGVFDSGLGGLSVLIHLKKALPDATFYYIADSANAPYGTRSDEFISQRSLQISRFLLSQQVDAIVIACNTATAAAVQEIRQHSPVPVVAIEPALKPAAQMSKSRVIGVLATASTLASRKYKQLADSYLGNVQCVEQAANGLVEQVEKGALDDAYTQQLLRQYLQPMLDQQADVIVLGCTHYPFLLSEIKKLVTQHAEVIDTGVAVTEQLKRVLSDKLKAESFTKPDDIFYTSGDCKQSEKVYRQLLGEAVQFEKLNI